MILNYEHTEKNIEDKKKLININIPTCSQSPKRFNVRRYEPLRWSQVSRTTNARSSFPESLHYHAYVKGIECHAGSLIWHWECVHADVLVCNNNRGFPTVPFVSPTYDVAITGSASFRRNAVRHFVLMVNIK